MIVAASPATINETLVVRRKIAPRIFRDDAGVILPIIARLEGLLGTTYLTLTVTSNVGFGCILSSHHRL